MFFLGEVTTHQTLPHRIAAAAPRLCVLLRIDSAGSRPQLSAAAARRG